VRRLLKGDLQTTIASDLDISTRVVQTYVQRAKAKFRCATLFQLAVRFVESKQL
jgi:DNA-binding CsgD family transcriptional regulator